jgi:hypothetical protein
VNIDLLNVDLVKMEKVAELGLLFVRQVSEIVIDKRSRPMVAGLCQRTKRAQKWYISQVIVAMAAKL